MSHISQADLREMRNSFRHDVAKRLAALATQRLTITYGQLSKEFDRNVRQWGDVLGGIALRCHEHKLPILSVLVVNAKSGLPSVDAVLYQDLGLHTTEQIKAEQERCFGFDWQSSPLR